MDLSGAVAAFGLVGLLRSRFLIPDFLDPIHHPWCR
jgi:hypothetical protein